MTASILKTGLLDLEAAGAGLVTVQHVLEGLCGDSDSYLLDILACFRGAGEPSSPPMETAKMTGWSSSTSSCIQTTG